MTMQYDVKSAYTANSTAQLVTGRVRLKQMVFVGNGSAGSVIVYDNGSNAASGNVIWQQKTSTGVQPFQVLIPGEGILAQNGIYVSTANIASVTVCYG